MAAFVSRWLEQANRHSLYGELIVVTREPLRFSTTGDRCPVRVIQAPPEAEERDMRNVGVRRARGEFILVTNAEVLFSEELVRFLASRQLQKGCVYRIDRLDVPAGGFPADRSVQDQLAYCQEHVVRICAREGVFESSEGLRQSGLADIVPRGSEIHFGAGWFAPECVGGQVFRWVENDAEVFLRTQGVGRSIVVELEPGPGVGRLQTPIQLRDRRDATVAQWQISGRTTVQFWVPPADERGRQSFRLYVPDGGRPVRHDPRILNFRVFRCGEAPLESSRTSSYASTVRTLHPVLARLLTSWRVEHGPFSLLSKGPPLFHRTVRLLGSVGRDIFGAGVEGCGKGWYGLEDLGVEKFRWVSNDAELMVRLTPKNRSVALLVEPGPGIGRKPFTLCIRCRDGRLAGRVQVSGVTYASVPIPSPPGVTTLLLSAEASGAPVNEDPRILSFRVFACGCVRGQPRDADVQKDTAGWPEITISERPSDIDWVERLRPWKREIAEMGMPVFPHLTACGDFTLMAREHWWDTRGYPEFERSAGYGDALLCCAAIHAGAREEILRDPLRVYRLSEQEPTEKAGEGLSHDELVWLIAQMRRLKTPLVFNRDDWGMANTRFEESTR